jgi:2,3-bisphosphoglycerate-independent phosphoglycerate mutase
VSDRRALLLILDGAGFRTDRQGNAVTQDTLPVMFDVMREQGFAVLQAAGTAVGLEEGQVGNSEAGHLTIGAGEVEPSMARKLALVAADGSWQADPHWQRLAARGPLHIVGLLSDAGVHALARTIHHAAAIAGAHGIADIVVHPVLDGVDSRAGTAPALLEQLQAVVQDIAGCRLGVIQGRKHVCDRSGDLDFSRVAADALCGRGAALPPFHPEELQAHLANGTSESSFKAHLFPGGRTVLAGESVLLTSHRADRARQIARVLAESQPLTTLLDLGSEIPAEHVFFPIRPRRRGLPFELQRAGIPSLRIAEKCKFPHVTHFFNGFDAGTEGEGVCIHSIPEDQIRSNPRMSADEITAGIVRAMQAPSRRAIVANLANLDQVGHLGDLELAQSAAQVVDSCLVRIFRAAQDHGYSVLVTADHGNAEVMADEHDRPFGSHTAHPVPLVALPAKGLQLQWRGQEGSLANVAATFLDALGHTNPDWMQDPLAHLAG